MEESLNTSLKASGTRAGVYEMKESNQGSAVCVLAVVVVVDVGISHAIGIELEAAYVNISIYYLCLLELQPSLS